MDAPSSGTSRTPTSFLRALASPWIGILRPGRGGRMLADASWASFVGVAIVHLVAGALVTLMLVAWFESVRIEWTSTGDQQTSAVDERPVSEVLASWRQPGRIDMIEATFVVFLTISVFATLGLAWLRFSDHHEGGPAWSSFARGWRAAFSVIGFALFFGGTFWTLAVRSEHADIRDYVARNRTGRMIHSARLFTGEAFQGVTNVVAGFWLVFASGRAVKGARRGLEVGPIPPTCEGCGYNLSHIPLDSLCPECGREAVSSLVNGHSRGACRWERPGPVAASFLWMTLDVLRSPHRTYSAMAVRGTEKLAERFRLFHYLLIVSGAAVWGFCCILADSRGVRVRNAIETATAITISATICSWCTQRGPASLVYAWWVYKRSLPDLRWARKVLAYETAYLWFFCVYNGLLVTSFGAFGSWISDTFLYDFTRRLIGIPPEAALILVGNALLILNWFRRYTQAMKAVRWANF